LNPAYNSAYYSRGTALYKIGRFDEAILDFQKACDLGNNFGCGVLQTLKRR